MKRSPQIASQIYGEKEVSRVRWMAWILTATLLVAGCTTGKAKPTPAPVTPAPAPAPAPTPTPEPEPEPAPEPEKPKPDPGPLPKTPAEVEKVLGPRAREVVAVLKARDMNRLMAWAHPEKGVRFTPYGYVNKKEDLVFAAEDLPGAWVNKRLYQWGIHDGSGEPINLGFRDYFEKFVYDVDFATAPKMGWNESVGHGNILDNWKEAYPEGFMVEFHFPGFDPKYGGMDWRSLRLIFERKGTAWFLVGIIHAQWTT